MKVYVKAAYDIFATLRNLLIYLILLDFMGRIDLIFECRHIYALSSWKLIHVSNDFSNYLYKWFSILYWVPLLSQSIRVLFLNIFVKIFEFFIKYELSMQKYIKIILNLSSTLRNYNIKCFWVDMLASVLLWTTAYNLLFVFALYNYESLLIRFYLYWLFIYLNYLIINFVFFS